MLLQLSPEVAPDDNQRAVLDDFATELATVLKVEAPQVRDALSAVYRADNWKTLVERDAAAAATPLYSIRIWDGHAEEAGEASFVASPACERLVAEQDRWYLSDDDAFGRDGSEFRKPQPEDAQNEEALRALLKRRPDFLYGYLIMGQQLSDRSDPECREVLSTGVRLGMALLREAGAQFLNWGSLGNRFFHRLLFASMRAQSRSLDAMALASMQLALNPSDNLGVMDEFARLVCTTADDADGDSHLLPDDGLLRLIGDLFMCMRLLGHSTPKVRKFAAAVLLATHFKVPAFGDLVLTGRVADPQTQPDKFLRPYPVEVLEGLALRLRWCAHQDPITLEVARRLFRRRKVNDAAMLMSTLFQGTEPDQWTREVEMLASKIADSYAGKASR